MSIFNTLKFIIQHPLNRGRQVRALVEFLKWQVGSRLVPGQVVFNWVNGARVIVRPGETGLTGNIYCGLHEFADMAFLLHVVRAGDVFVDVGANVGSYTILACAAKGARGFCFEPVPATFARLQDNIRLNNLAGRVEAFNLGLADQEGELVFTADANCMNHVVAEQENAGAVVRVRVLPLDAALKNQSPTVLKIDVEGFETPVLHGARATLRNKSLQAVIMELNGSGARYGFNEDDLLRMMSGYGFATYAYEPFSRKLTALAGKSSLAGNTLFVRDEQTVRERIAKAPAVFVGNVRL